MYFILSKTVGVLAVPSTDLFLLAVVGAILLRTRFARAGRLLLRAGFVLLIVICVLPLGTALTLALEQRFSPWRGSGAPPDGMIVLGGVIDPDLSAARNSMVIGDAAERITEAARLARRYPAARIAFCGGNGSLVLSGPPEAEYALQLFETFGIARDRLLIEDRSRNTAENARFCKRLIDPKPGERWLLITSAAHMPRAVGAFRKAGWSIEPYPVDWQTAGVSDLWSVWLPPLENLMRTDRATKEWIGLAVYWLTGLSSQLLPGPTQ